MKERFYSNSIFLLLLVMAFPVLGQDGITIIPVEKVSLVTDRSLYIVGERLQFSAMLSSELQAEPSQILYVEMITPEGRQISGNKYSIDNGVSSGCLSIPDEVVTGYYYVRAYTKYMRNVGPACYGNVLVKIVNPLSNEVLFGNGISAVEKEEYAEHQNAFVMSTDKSEYTSGESVKVTLSLKNTAIINTIPFSGGRLYDRSGGWVYDLIISICPESTSFMYQSNVQVVDRSFSSITYSPETRGVSITGQFRDGADGHPVVNGRVNLSIIGQGRDFEAMQTDTAGKFYFSLPNYTGRRDIFLCAEKDSLVKPILLVDNDFCSLPVALPSPLFSLSAQERTAAFNMARNVRIAKYFYPDTLTCSNKNELSENPFYGQADDVLHFDEYVQLPTLEEYFNELPSSVRVRKQGGHKYFKVIGERAEMNYFNPLVMIDWVAVNNPEKILAAAPSAIDRIEVITEPYIKGNITYGGIVSIISKRGDFAGIDLPASGIFFNYLFLADTCHCHVMENVSTEQPDTRNTLYWDPELRQDANNRTEFSFKSPGTPGKYDMVIKGILLNGEVYVQRTSFVVK